MDITNKKYFTEYYKLIGKEIKELANKYDFSDTNGGFGYSTQVSAIFSSNIEGNSVDLNTFMNYKLSKEKFKPTKEIEEIENLISAYEFAQNNKLTEKNILECHKILSETLVIKSKRGKYRKEKVGIFGQAGLVYLAVEPEFVENKMNILLEQIEKLLNTTTSIEEEFYYASFIHLRFAHIHPFQDGNGRTARLIEKWFLAEKTGIEYWKIPAEKYYKENQAEYYKNINLGFNFYELNYDKCIPFLAMLPNCMKE